MAFVVLLSREREGYYCDLDKWNISDVEQVIRDTNIPLTQILNCKNCTSNIDQASFRIYVIHTFKYILPNAFNHTIFVLVPQKVFIQLETVLVKYGLMIWLAMDMNTHWQTVFIQPGDNITVVMEKMWELIVWTVTLTP